MDLWTPGSPPLLVARLARFAAVVPTTLLVVGCLGSPEPSVRLLTLPSATVGVPGGGTDELREIAVGLGPVGVSPHLERRPLAYRIDETRVEFADSAQWAAPLEEMITEYVGTRLVTAAGVRSLVNFPWSAARIPDVQLTLQVLEFAVYPDGQVGVSVLWSVREPASGRGLDSGVWERTSPSGPSAADQVRALTSTLDALVASLAGELVEGARSRSGGLQPEP